MALRTFTGTIYHATNSPWASAKMRLNLVTMFAMVDGTYPVDTIPLMTNPMGVFSVELPVPDDPDAAAQWTLLLPNGKLVTFNASYSASPLTLEAVLITTLTPAQPNALQVLIDQLIVSLPTLLADILVAGAGISIDLADGLITITNTGGGGEPPTGMTGFDFSIADNSGYLGVF